MIISHKHKYIFFAVPKTGTHSIRRALRKSMGDNDIEQVGLFEKKSFPYSDIAKMSHGHIKPNQIVRHLDGEVWNKYFKFAFFRDPVERFLSLCYFYTRNKKSRLESFILDFIENARFLQDNIIFHKQSDFVSDKYSNIVVDFIGRYENLQEDFNFICDTVGIERENLEVVNRCGGYEDVRLDDSLLKKIKQVYKKDFELKKIL